MNAVDRRAASSGSTSTSARSTGSCSRASSSSASPAGRSAAPATRGGAAYSASLMKVFGGAQGAAIWHRVGAVLIILSAVYHLFYLTFLAAKKRLPFSMLPMPKDALDMKDNILFMLGVTKERPKFDRYSYLEKFDYMGVFWGMILMVGTGFIFWFPAWFASWAPSWLITAAHHPRRGGDARDPLPLRGALLQRAPEALDLPDELGVADRAHHRRDLKHEHPLEYERLKPDVDK